MSELYRRVTNGKRVTYVPFTPEPEPETLVILTDDEMITAAATLGTVLLMLAERQFPPHKLIRRKIEAVEAAILDLYHGTGKELDLGIAEQFCSTWDRVMKEMSV